MNPIRKPLNDVAGKFEVEKLDFNTFERINDKYLAENQSSNPPHVAINSEIPIGSIITNKATGEQAAVFVVADKNERRVDILSIDRLGDYGLGTSYDGHLILGLQKGDLDGSIEVTQEGLDKKGVRVPADYLSGLIANERISDAISKAHIKSEEKRKSEIKDVRDIRQEIVRLEKHFKHIRELKETENAMDNPIQIMASMDPTSVLYVEQPEPSLTTRESIKRELNNSVPFSNGEHELKDPAHRYLVSEFKPYSKGCDEIKNSLLNSRSSYVETGVRVREKGSQAGFVVAVIKSNDGGKEKPLLNIRGVTLDKEGNVLKTGDDALKTIGLYQDSVIYADTEGLARDSYYKNRPEKSIYSQHSEKQNDEFRVNSIKGKVSAGHMNELVSKKTLTHEHAKRIGILEGQPLFNEESVADYVNSKEYKLNVQRMQDDFIMDYQEHLVKSYSLSSDEALQLTKRNTPLEILNGINATQAILEEEGLDSDLVSSAREFTNQELLITGHPIYDDLDESLNTEKDFNFPGSSIPDEKEPSEEAFLSDAYNISERQAAEIVRSVGSESFIETVRSGRHQDPEEVFTQILKTNIENARIKNDMDRKIDEMQKNPLDVPVSSENRNKIAGMLLSGSYLNSAKADKLDLFARKYSTLVWGSDLPPKVDLGADYGSKFAWKEQASLILDKKTKIYELADAKKKESDSMKKQLELQKQEMDLLASKYLKTVKEANKERVLAYVEMTGSSKQLDKAKSIFKQMDILEESSKQAEKDVDSLLTNEESEYIINTNKESVRKLKDNLSAITYNLEDYDIALDQKEDPEAKKAITAFREYIKNKEGGAKAELAILDKRGDLFDKAVRLRTEAQESKIIFDDMRLDAVVASREAEIVQRVANMDRLDRFAKTVLHPGNYRNYQEAKESILKMHPNYADEYSARGSSVASSRKIEEEVLMVRNIEKPIRDYDLSKADLSKMDDEAFIGRRKTRNDVKLMGDVIRKKLEDITFQRQVKDLQTMFEPSSQERLIEIKKQNKEFKDSLTKRPEPSKNKDDIHTINKYISQISSGNVFSEELYNAGVTYDDVADNIHKALVERGVDIRKEDIKSARDSFILAEEDLFVAFDMKKYPTVQILNKNDDKGLEVIDYTPKNMAENLGVIIDKNQLSNDGRLLASSAKDRLSQIEKHSNRLKSKFELEDGEAKLIAHTFPKEGEFEKFVSSIEEESDLVNPGSKQSQREAISVAIEYAKAQKEEDDGIGQDSVKESNNIQSSPLDNVQPSRNRRRPR